MLKRWWWRALVPLIALLAPGCHSRESAAPTNPVPPTGQKVSVVPGDDASTAAATTEWRFEEHGDGTITDRVTGLTWEKKCDNCQSYHGVAETFRWTGSAPDTVDKFLAALNAENGKGFGGHNDWRVPTTFELVGLVDYGLARNGMAAAIDPIFGPTNSFGGYWAVDPVSGSNEHMSVGFGAGGTGGDDGSRHIRAVRGPTPPVHTWRDNGDGTATDLTTGLMWEKKCTRCGGLHDAANTYGWNPDSPQPIWSWIKDVNAEDRTGYAGHNDWRVPNVKELASLVAGYGRPATLNAALGTPMWTWSSTPTARQEDFAWTLTERGNLEPVGRANALFVRAVRTVRAGEAAPRQAVSDEETSGQPNAAARKPMPEGCRIPEARLATVLARPYAQALLSRIARNAQLFGALGATAPVRRADDGGWQLVDVAAGGADQEAIRELVAADGETRKRLAGLVDADGTAGAALRDTCIVDAVELSPTKVDDRTNVLMAVRLERPWGAEPAAAVSLAGALIDGHASAAGPPQGLIAGPVRWQADPALADARGSAPLGYLYRADGSVVNVELVRRGLATADPNPRLALHDALLAAEADARTAQRGLWSTQTMKLVRGGDSSDCGWRGGAIVSLQDRTEIRLAGLLSSGRDPEVDSATCAALRQQLDGATVQVNVDAALGNVDGYATYNVVTADGVFVNAELVRRGVARLDPAQMARAPERAEELMTAEHEARAAGRGRWAHDRVSGLENHQSCPLGFNADGHYPCHLFRFDDGATVGLLGVRLPGRADYLHNEAHARAAELVSGVQPRLEFDSAGPMRPGCDLAYLSLPDGRMVNVELVREGLARADVGGLPLREAATLRAAQNEAKQARRGLWGGPQLVSSVVREGATWINLRSGKGVSKLTGVTVPNLGEGHDKAVSALLAEILLGASLELASDPALANLGVHGGVYATLSDGRSLNVELVRQGLAYVDPLPQPYQLERELRAAEAEARTAGRGLWAAHEVLGAAIRGPLVILVLSSGDKRYDPPNLTVQLVGVASWSGRAETVGKLVSKLTTNQPVHLAFDPNVPRDPIITPAYAYMPDGNVLNAELIRAGFGRVDTHRGQLRLLLDDQMVAAERAAKDGEVGMWSKNPADPDPVPTLDPAVVAEALRPPVVSGGPMRAPMANRRVQRQE